MAKMTDLEENLQLSVRKKVGMCKGARKIYKRGKHYITLYGFQKKSFAPLAHLYYWRTRMYVHMRADDKWQAHAYHGYML